MEEDLKEALDALAGMVIQHCYVDAAEEIDSGFLSANAEAMDVLAKHGRLKIITQSGRLVIGKWTNPENPANW